MTNVPKTIDLVKRLNRGWVMCECETDPQKKERLENHWIDVLRQYEAACDEVTMSSLIGVAA